ncbi:MAG: thermonuclease family protein [Pyrinomonadaceae bacterium]
MVKKSVNALIILALAAIGIIAQKPQPSPSVSSNKRPSISTNVVPNEKSELIEGTVVAVDDGDTISILTADQTSYKVRLQAIDAPDDRQPYFDKSRKRLSNLLLKTDVKAMVHSKDSNDMLIATVYQEGRDIGLIQIENGMAWHDKRYLHLQTPSGQKSYADAQTKAVKERKGLWDDKNPIPPWVFRGDVMTAQPVNPVNANENVPAQTGDRKYILGPRGGCYYIKESGSKVYVKDKSLCGTPPVEKP